MTTVLRVTFKKKFGNEPHWEVLTKKLILAGLAQLAGVGLLKTAHNGEPNSELFSPRNRPNTQVGMSG